MQKKASPMASFCSESRLCSSYLKQMMAVDTEAFSSQAVSVRTVMIHVSSL